MPDSGAVQPAGPGRVAVPDPPRRRAHLGKCAAGHAEQFAELLRPFQCPDVVEERPAGVGRVGDEGAAVRPAGQVPGHPGVDRPERQAGGGGVEAADGRAAIPPWWPRSRGRARGPVAARIVRLLPGLLEGVASIGRAPVLPHQRPVERTAGAAVPGHHRLPLVRDPDGGHRHAARRPGDRRARPRVVCTADQISAGSCSTQPGRGKCCVSSRYEKPQGRPSPSTAKARTPVVPASTAIRAGISCRRLSADLRTRTGGGSTTCGSVC